MNYQQFRSLIAEMRAAQKEYFRTRSSDLLTLSKRLEKQVDAELTSNGQKSLLEEEEG